MHQNEEKISVEEIRRRNAAIPVGAEAILLDIYWSFENEHDPTAFYLSSFYRPLMENAINKLNFPTYIAIPDDPVGEYPQKIIGLMIMGGADIHPKFYGEEVNGTDIKPNSYHRYPYLLKIYQWARHKIPILGICFGAEFITIVEGGSLIQHLPNSKEHVKLFNKLYVEQGSWLHETVGAEELICWCNHHQGIGQLPPNFQLCLRDAEQMPHGYENRQSKLIAAILPHPERPESEPINFKIISGFVEECKAQR